MKKLVLFCLPLLFAFSANAQLRNDDVYKMDNLRNTYIRNEIRIPGFDGYQTLKCDFHIHTVFSDGVVWPTARVEEAWQLGLDAIAITDHIEGYPSRAIGDHNTSVQLAKQVGEDYGFIVIHGAEITRSKPLGHLNALFINDANKLDVDDPLEAIDAALAQGAFIEWNHPGWPDDLSTVYPVHEELLKAGKIHGIEVINYMEYYPKTFDWCLKYNLPPLSNSDIHGTSWETYGSNLRPITLVFAEDKSEQGIKDALFAGRTAALFDGNLFAKEEYLVKLISESLKLNFINTEVVEITNVSDIAYSMTNGDDIYYLPGAKTIRLNIPSSGDLVFQNCYVGMHKKLTIPYESWSKLILPTPMITPAKGLFAGKATIAIEGGVAGDEIHYTVDGTTPTYESPKYKGPFDLKETAVVKAVIFRNGVRGGVRSANIRLVPDGVKPNIAYKYYDSFKEYLEELPDFSKLGAPARSGYIHELSLGELDVEGKDQFAVLLTTRLQIDETGFYKFDLTSDDGAKLYIDGKLIVDNNGSHSAKMESGSIHLKKGLHSLRIEYFDDCEEESISLYYQSETIVRQPVPVDKFRR